VDWPSRKWSFSSEKCLIIQGMVIHFRKLLSRAGHSVQEIVYSTRAGHSVHEIVYSSRAGHSVQETFIHTRLIILFEEIITHRRLVIQFRVFIHPGLVFQLRK
jgi:hypothetical protein